MEAWWRQVSDQTNCVAVFLPWSVEGQCANNNAAWLPGRLDQILSVCEIGVGTLFCEERWSASMRTDARARGYGVRMGTHHTGRSRERLWRGGFLYPTQRYRGLMKEEGKGGWGEITSTHRLLTHSHAHTHCRLISHLLGDREYLTYL